MSQLSAARSTYQFIKQRIIATEPNIDETTLADTLEGLTDLNEVIAAIVRSAVTDEALAVGLKTHLTTLRDRLERIQERANNRRQIARDAMLEVSLQKIAAPDFTVSVRPGPVALVVTEETAVPTEYWEPQPPRLNRFRLLSDLKGGAIVPGAVMSNPIPVLSVRTR